MSHFSVAVLTRDGQDIDELLAPYDENSESYADFISGKEQFGENYLNDTMRKLRMPNGDCLDIETCKVEISEDEYNRLYYQDKIQIDKGWDRENGYKFYKYDPEAVGGKLEEVKMCEIYPTIEDYLRDHWELVWDEHNKEYGYYSNANAKWDWYQVGGRFAGSLKAKKEAVDVQA